MSSGAWHQQQLELQHQIYEALGRARVHAATEDDVRLLAWAAGIRTTNQEDTAAMSRYASETTFVQCPEGTYHARCIRIYDLGVQHGEFAGEPTVQKKIMFVWELPNELMAEGKPYTISKFYRNSLNKKSKLREDLQSWRGKAFSAEELARFDLATVLGKTCSLTVIHNDKGRAEVVGITNLPRNTTVPDAVNPVWGFFLDEWDEETFAKLPEGIQKMVRASDEYKQLMSPAAMKNDLPAEELSEDIPF